MIDKLDAIPLENITRVNPTERLLIPLYSSMVQAGFASPAENYIEQRLNLQDLCVPHPETAYFVKAVGESMIGDYIYPA
ncbi:hypothetical protein GCM10028818_22910 [Spirosoma horti]